MSNLLLTKSHYLPGKEALFVYVEYGDFLVDYYLHAKSLNEVVAVEHVEKLKQLFACFAAHLTIQPASGSHAWTLHLHGEHPISLFVAGEVQRGFIVGHVISSNIRHTDVNTLHAQVINHGESNTSSVQCESSEISEIVEHFYIQSEQLPLKLSLASDADTAIALAAMPGHDLEWFQSADLNQLSSSEDPSWKLMRQCELAFNCDCSAEKLVPYFRTINPNDIEELFGSEDSLTITCPRCGRDFELTRTHLKLDS